MTHLNFGTSYVRDLASLASNPAVERAVSVSRVSLASWVAELGSTLMKVSAKVG